jgi:hypothetical protein
LTLEKLRRSKLTGTASAKQINYHFLLLPSTAFHKSKFTISTPIDIAVTRSFMMSLYQQNQYVDKYISISVL